MEWKAVWALQGVKILLVLKELCYVAMFVALNATTHRLSGWSYVCLLTANAASIAQMAIVIYFVSALHGYAVEKKRAMIARVWGEWKHRLALIALAGAFILIAFGI
jgi:hypothetical protein